MATHILFANGQGTTVTETEEEVVTAVRRDHPNPVKLEGTDGLVEYVNWAHVSLIQPAPAAPPPDVAKTPKGSIAGQSPGSSRRCVRARLQLTSDRGGTRRRTGG